MKFAKYTFLIGAIYGLAALLPLYFLESWIGADYPPAITHPEFFYGFLGVASAFQIVFLIISSDPVKYRVFIIPSIVEKSSFTIAGICLYLSGRLNGPMIGAIALDLVLVILFVMSWFKLSGASDIEVESESVH